MGKRIGLVPFRPSAGDINLTYKKITSWMAEARDAGVSILCFPEMALTGYILNPSKEIIRRQNEILHGIQKLSAEYSMAVLAGGIEYEDSRYYISQFAVNSPTVHSGIRTFRKIHPGYKERENYCGGDRVETFEASGLKFGIMLCYDGHFPELSRDMALGGAEMIFVPSAAPNDPPRRVEMWKKYLGARAYDNRVNVAAVNLLFPGQGEAVRLSLIKMAK